MTQPNDFDIIPFWYDDDPWPSAIAGGIDFFRAYYAEKYRLWRLLAPRSFLEIGVRTGYGAATVLSACPEAVYLGIDPFAPDNWWPKTANYAMGLLSRHFPGRGGLIVADTGTMKALPGDSWDVIYVDGDHTQEGALRDLRLAAAAMPRWIVADDVIDPAVRKACLLWLVESGWRGIFLPTLRGDLVAQAPDYG